MNLIRNLANKEAKKSVEKDYAFLCQECKKKMVETIIKDYYKIFLMFVIIFVGLGLIISLNYLL